MRLTMTNVTAALAGSPEIPPNLPSEQGMDRKSDPSPCSEGEAGRGVICEREELRWGSEAAIFTSVSTDTRDLQPGALFVALVSPKADGHDFVAQAVSAGAAGLVVSRDVSASVNLPVFRVPDTEIAYGQLARWWRDQFDIPVIGVTGSVGKTTVKEMLAAALSPLGPVLKTAASQNNETGVPKALLQLTSEHKAAVIEMGMRGAGQIAALCRIARPTVGVITVISDNHLELLGSRDAIADAKGELLESLPTTGTAILNADDAYLERLRAKTQAHVVTYSSSSPTDTSPGPASQSTLSFRKERVPNPELGAEGMVFTVQGVSVEIASPSRHDIGNALAALTVAETIGVPLTEAALALRQYTPPPMRMEIIKTGWGGTILNDAYNASPASMRSALETLMDYGTGRKVAFLGDMKELGNISETAHQELGTVIEELGGLDALYTVGALAAQIPGATAYFPSSDEAASFATESLILYPGDVYLVKGSRAMAMERIVHALQQRNDPAVRNLNEASA
jgi:UDP-N-acetylmuramoyl-tripeptide--D-alanyl-D-alanine ligase